MLETALIFLTFIAMLIGAFDFGQFLFIHQALVERARYAARWGAINDPTNFTSIQNKVLYDQATVPSSPNPYFGLTSSMATVTTADGNPKTDSYRLVVSIHDYPYVMLSPYIAGTHNGPNITVEVPLGYF
jgi:hypothetical protein